MKFKHSSIQAFRKFKKVIKSFEDLMFNPTSLSFLMIAVFFSSCQKNPIPSSEVLENKTISNRSIEDDQWLIDFQNYLKSIIEENPTENIYSLNEAIYGTEALINNVYARMEMGTSVFMHSSTFTISENSDWSDLFEISKTTILNTLQENQNPNLHLGVFNIALDSIANGNAFISTNTILQNTSECVIENYNTSLSCNEFSDGPFDSDESFYLGVGGWSADEPDGTADACLLVVDDPGDCGGIADDCNSVLTTGPDQIEDRLNTFFPPAECPMGMKLSYTDIQSLRIPGSEWNEGFSNCYGYLTPDFSFKPCQCMPSELLNCMYCVLDEAITTQSNSHPFYIDIPPGYHFISINIGVDFLSAGGAFEDYHTRFTGEYYYGKPVCKPDPKGGGVFDPILFPLTP